MHRARSGLVGGAALLACLAVSPQAWAFHAGNLFDKPPGGGGGGGLFYTGSPRERGWTCTSCHTEAPGQIRVTWTSDPPELLQDGFYVPEEIYQIEVVLENEHLGQASPLSNYNTMVLSILDTDLADVGSLFGFSADEFYNRGNGFLASSGTNPNETSWSFTWAAPVEGTDTVTMYLAVVDGNGANSPPGETLTDPFGDDVWVGRQVLGESEPATIEATSHDEGEWSGGCSVVPRRAPASEPSAAVWALLGLLGLARRPRRALSGRPQGRRLI